METDSEYSGSTICSEQLNADDDYSEYKSIFDLASPSSTIETKLIPEMNADERETGIDSKIMQQQFISAIEGTTSTDTASGASKTTKKPKTSRKPKSKSKISGESTKSRKSKAAPLNTTSIVNAVEKTGTMTTKPKRVRVKKSTAKQEQILGVEDILNDISAKKTVVGVADQKPNESGKMVTGTKLPPRKKSSVVVKNKTAEVNKPGAVHNNTEEPKIASNEPAGDKKKNRKRASKNETADEPEPKPKRQRKKKVQSPECSEVVLGDSGIVCEAKSNTTPMDNQRRFKNLNPNSSSSLDVTDNAHRVYLKLNEAIVIDGDVIRTMLRIFVKKNVVYWCPLYDIVSMNKIFREIYYNDKLEITMGFTAVGFCPVVVFKSQSLKIIEKGTILVKIIDLEDIFELKRKPAIGVNGNSV